MTYDWRDLNGDRNYDPGEVNLDPNGPDFRSGGAQLNAFLNPDENIPGAEEYSIGFERQLTQTVAVRVSGVYLKNFNVNRSLNPLRPYEVYTIPISRLDPGPDGVNGTSDDPGKTLTYWDYPASYRGAAFEGVKLVNDDPKNDSTYKTIEFAATRRLSNGWQFMGSYSATKRNVPFVDGSALTPNAEINTADNTWTWIGKLSGSYTFRMGNSERSQLQQAQRGAPGATGADPGASRFIHHEPRGQRRADRQPEPGGRRPARRARGQAIRARGRAESRASPRHLQHHERESGDLNRHAGRPDLRERHRVGRRWSERDGADASADFHSSRHGSRSSASAAWTRLSRAD